MNESYCIKDKRVTPCVEPSGYQTEMVEDSFIVIVLFVE